LFSFVGGRGHIEPLLPIARAAEEAGHSVAFVGRPSRLPAAETLGFDVLPLGSPSRSEPLHRRPLLELDVRREERDVRERFIRDAARERAPAAIALYAEWQPDVVVCDQMDFGALLRPSGSVCRMRPFSSSRPALSRAPPSSPSP
jgi:UDP:flavonoid glycosyltransferase YjiC (YdhE family)